MSPSQPPADAIPTLPSFRNMTLHEKLAHSNEASKHYAAYHVRPFVTPTYLRPVSTSGDWQTQIKPVHDAFDALLTQYTSLRSLLKSKEAQGGVSTGDFRGQLDAKLRGVRETALHFQVDLIGFESWVERGRPGDYEENWSEEAGYLAGRGGEKVRGPSVACDEQNRSVQWGAADHGTREKNEELTATEGRSTKDQASMEEASEGDGSPHKRQDAGGESAGTESTRPRWTRGGRGRKRRDKGGALIIRGG
jgi:hypothetical protein